MNASLATAALAFVAIAVPTSASAAAAHRTASFRVGAASVSYTPPRAGQLANDPANCDHTGQFNGPRKFAFEEPYKDLQGSGHFDSGDPYVDCNGNGRWDGNLLGGGSDSPRFYDHVADKVGARAMVVSNGKRTIAVEVLDNEGAFNVYLQRIRRQVHADGVNLDGIYISSNHDESAPDTIGISGLNAATSSVNAYFAKYMVQQSAKAIEDAVASQRSATIRYAEAKEPSNLRQCWSSYPFVDDQQMPSLQAVGTNGKVIATLANVSQHAESLGFNPDEAQKTVDHRRLDPLLPGEAAAALRRRRDRDGRVSRQRRDARGLLEGDLAHPAAVHRREPPGGLPDAVRRERHSPRRVGYDQETKALGQSLAGAVGDALKSKGRPSRTGAIWGKRSDICVPLTNTLFALGAQLGRVRGPARLHRQLHPEVPGRAQRQHLRRRGEEPGRGVPGSATATFMSVPGEVFPFTYLRGFLGPNDMPKPEPPLPPWPMPYMHTPYRFIDGLGEDMVGYIFPVGNGVGVPGEDPGGNDTDRFGCGHSDDSEAASSHTSDIAGQALVGILQKKFGKPEKVAQGRYVLPDGKLSRDPLGGPEIKCDVDTTFNFAGRAERVWIPGRGKIRPAAWMSLDGRRQGHANRNTRGYFNKQGKPVWLDVYEPLQ